MNVFAKFWQMLSGPPSLRREIETAVETERVTRRKNLEDWACVTAGRLVEIMDARRKDLLEASLRRVTYCYRNA